MNRKIRFSVIVILLLSLGQINTYGQTSDEGERTIYLMRAKQFYGSGARMNVMVNGELFHQMKSGSRLIIKLKLADTLSVQIVYPLIKSHKSETLQILPDSENEIYVDLFYWGEGYNPLKHAGVVNPRGSSPDFNIEIIKMNKEEGKEKFNHAEFFKDNKKISEKRYS